MRKAKDRQLNCNAQKQLVLDPLQPILMFFVLLLRPESLPGFKGNGFQSNVDPTQLEKPPTLELELVKVSYCFCALDTLACANTSCI